MSSLYFNQRFFIGIAILVVLFVISYFYPSLLVFIKLLLLAFFILMVFDFFVLFTYKNAIISSRKTPEKLSNGDANPISISIQNNYPFVAQLTIIDEVPFQFQLRNVEFKIYIASKQQQTINYQLYPTQRGQYSFGAVNVYAQSPIQLICRKYKFDNLKTIPVYPSYMQMKKYELLAISNQLQDSGIKRIRRLGQSSDFEQIREYVVGDDYRTMNWKATARLHQNMVNQYQEEKSQQVYLLINKGRLMKMPFNGLSLLDYAINASLAMANIAIKKSDKAGLLTFSNTLDSLLKTECSLKQIYKIQKILYAEKTNFLESNYEILYATCKKKINQRSLLLLFTNFETLSGLQRQLPYLQKIAKLHLLVVIFFENTELKQFTYLQPKNIEETYQQTIAEKLYFEKQLIIKELQKFGIQSVYTTPQNLTINTINKYLEIKARRMI